MNVAKSTTLEGLVRSPRPTSTAAHRLIASSAFPTAGSTGVTQPERRVGEDGDGALELVEHVAKVEGLAVHADGEEHPPRAQRRRVHPLHEPRVQLLPKGAKVHQPLAWSSRLGAPVEERGIARHGGALIRSERLGRPTGAWCTRCRHGNAEPPMRTADPSAASSLAESKSTRGIDLVV